MEKISQEIVAPQVVEKIPSQEIPLQKIVSQEPVQQESELQPVQKEQCTHSVDQQESVLPMIDLNDVTFIGVQDLEHLELQQLVAGKLAQYWKRPVGMESKLCVIKIELHANGKILSVVVEKSSGVPMYDMAAKAAALKTIYPQEIWNKKLVIQF